jgi:hypothetical protein
MPNFYSCELCDIWTEPECCETCEKSKCAYCGDCAEKCKEEGGNNNG